MALLAGIDNKIEDFEEDAGGLLITSEILTSSDPAITAANMRERSYDPRLGNRFRFVPSFYIYSSGASRNNMIDLEENDDAVERSITLTGSASGVMYTAQELATEIEDKLTLGAPSTYTCSWDEDTRKFTISINTGTFELWFATGSNAANSVASTIGFAAADVGSDDAVPNTDITSDSTADNEGHWLKFKNNSDQVTGNLDIFACYKPRYARLSGDTTSPASKDFELRMKHYTHASDLGNDPDLWAASATLQGTYTLYDQNAAPPSENEWYVNLDASPVALEDHDWHIFIFDDADDATNSMDWLEFGYLYIGPKTTISSASSRLFAQSQQRPVVRTLQEPRQVRESHSSFAYSSARPQYWKIGLQFVAWDETSWEDFLSLYRTNGRITPWLWILDDTAPNGNNYRNSYWALFDNDFENAVQELDYYNFQINLRQVVD